MGCGKRGPLWILIGHTDHVESVVFSWDGVVFASGSIDGTICLWEAKAAPPAKLEVQNDVVISLAFSPDGRTLASGGTDKMIYLWDVWDLESGDPLLTFGRAYGFYNIYSIAFSPDGLTLASGSGGWDNPPVGCGKQGTPAHLGRASGLGTQRGFLTRWGGIRFSGSKDGTMQQ